MKAARNLFIAFAIIAMASVLMFGQAETGQLVGTVSDPSGAVVTGATVTATNVGTGAARTATTGTNGGYAITNLNPGTYDVSVTGPGFQPFKQRIAVSVGGRETVDAKLGVQAAGTTVEVNTEAGAVVNTTDQQISQVVNQQQIQNLPTLNRDPYNLVATAGNVSSDPNGSTVRGVGVAINGQRAASTDILLDGGENVDLFGATVGQTVPLDSVQEFRVITSNYTAEYGRASGGVVNVATRSGTNAFHGSLYEFNRNSALASNTYNESANDKFLLSQGLPRTPHDRFNRNQFGYALGGPIIRDKIFFFSSTEWTRVRSAGNQTAYVLDPAFLAITSPATQAFFAKYGANLAPGAIRGAPFSPTGSPYAVPVFDLVSYSVPSNAGAGDPQNGYSTVNRVDLNLTQNTTLYGRYGLESANAFVGTNAFSPYAGYNTGYSNYNQNAMFNLTHVFSPNVVNQFKTVFNRLNNSQPLGAAPVGPTLYLSRANTATAIGGIDVALPGYLPFTPGNAIPFGGPQNLYQFFDDLSWTKGNHQLRFGGDYIHIRDNRIFGAFETSVEQVGHNSVLGGLANLVSGNLFAFQGAVNPNGAFPCPTDVATGTVVSSPSCQINLPATPPSFARNNRFNDGAAYGQDTWKVSPRLNLNLGLRWEYYGPQHNANPNLESNFYLGDGTNFFEQVRAGQVFTTPTSPIHSLWKAQYKNFAPRVGFAYDILGNGKWSVRGGYGISYERNFGNVTYNVIQNPPNYAVVALTAGVDVPTIPITTDNAGPLAGSGVTVNLPKTSLRAVDPNIKTAYAHQYSLALEHELFPNTVLSLEYSGSRGVHQYGIMNINRPFSGNVYLGDTLGCTGAGTATSCGGATGTVGNTLNTQYTNINFRSSNGDSYYNGLNVRLQSTNFRNAGLTFTTNYTWSHAIDNLSSTFSESGNNFNLGYLDPFNPALDRGNADFDTRHRLVFSGIWEPTFLAFKNHRLLEDTIGGWQFAPIFTARTGTPFTVYDCTNAFSACPRILNVPGLKKSSGTETPVDPAVAGSAGIYDYISLPAAAANPYGNPAFGGGGFPGYSDLPICNTPGFANGQCTLTRDQAGIARNSFYGPPVWNLDLGLYKNIRFTERVGLQLRGEFFNILNHHNFYVNGSTADIAEGSTVQTVKGSPGGSPTALDERRNVQLGIKINF